MPTRDRCASPQSLRFATAVLFSAAALTFSAAAALFSAAADPTLCVRSTLRLAPTADLIRPFRRRNPPCPAAPFCHHSPTRLRPLPDLPLTTAKSGGGHSPTSALSIPPIPPISAVHSCHQATSTVCSVWSYCPTRFGILPDSTWNKARPAPPYSPTLTSKRPRITRFQLLDNPCHVHSNPGTVS